ncbi:RT0821/Lpp0805 family surface protein [Rhodocista pekingensis]|uniref:17 kDa surface antigen n=1 Tax=Rhodocista pekingensis TaxID=201185 RepID=A0ABW2KVY6_9PROT
MIRKVVLVAVTAAMLAGCTSTGGQKQGAGAVLGGLAGGLAGSQIGGGSGRLWATGAGVLLGALIGSEVGASLDRADQLALERNTRTAWDRSTPLNQPIIWDNPDNGNRVVVTPTREGRTQAGAYCREFQQRITVGGRSEEAYGQACQQPDGSWKIVS